MLCTGRDDFHADSDWRRNDDSGCATYSDCGSYSQYSGRLSTLERGPEQNDKMTCFRLLATYTLIVEGNPPETIQPQGDRNDDSRDCSGYWDYSCLDDYDGKVVSYRLSGSYHRRRNPPIDPITRVRAVLRIIRSLFGSSGLGPFLMRGPRTAPNERKPLEGVGTPSSGLRSLGRTLGPSESMIGHRAWAPGAPGARLRLLAMARLRLLALACLRLWAPLGVNSKILGGQHGQVGRDNAS